jgi:hypothetical protein
MLVGLLALTSQIATPTIGAMIDIVMTAVMISAMITVTATMTIMTGVNRMTLGDGRATIE